jgi:hypothetical protein
MTLCAVFAFAAAVIAATMIRNKDLHPSALTGIPPELPGEGDEDRSEAPSPEPAQS